MKENRQNKCGNLCGRIVSLVTLIALFIGATGCTKLVRVSADEISSTRPTKAKVDGEVVNIQAVELVSGEKVEFESPGGMIPADSNKIIALTKRNRDYKTGLVTGGEEIEIHLDSVEYMVFQEQDSGKTNLFFLGLFVVVVGVVVGLGALGDLNAAY